MVGIKSQKKTLRKVCRFWGSKKSPALRAVKFFPHWLAQPADPPRSTGISKSPCGGYHSPESFPGGIIYGGTIHGGGVQKENPWAAAEKKIDPGGVVSLMGGVLLTLKQKSALNELSAVGLFHFYFNEAQLLKAHENGNPQ